MARPPKLGAEWFSHSVHAFNDSKIEILRLKHKNDGYAFYFYMLEQIYQKDNYEMDLSGDDAEDLVFIMSSKLSITVDDFHNILNTCLKCGLFDKNTYEERKCITSNGVKKRSQLLEDKREYDKNRHKNNKLKNEKDSFHSENEVKKNENDMNSHSFHTHSIAKDSIVKHSKAYNSIEPNDTASPEKQDVVVADEKVFVPDGSVAVFKRGMSQTQKRRPLELRDIPELLENWYFFRSILNEGIKPEKIIALNNQLPVIDIARLWYWAKKNATKNVAGYFFKIFDEIFDDPSEEIIEAVKEEMMSLNQKDPLLEERSWRKKNDPNIYKQREETA